MTLGPGLLLLAGLERVKGVFARVFDTFGKVPLFLDLIHIPVVRLLAFV